MKKLVLLTLIFISPYFIKAQEEEKDPNKILREVVAVEMVKPKEVKPPPPPPTETKGKKGKHHVEEPPPEEEVPAEEEPTEMIPATVAELAMRANAWYNQKNKKYEKEQGASSGSKMTCVAKFAYVPKELNPVNDVEGTITMQVTLDFKEGKYRYTIEKMEHTAKRGVCTGGDVFNEVPKCGSMSLNSTTWKQIKSAALSMAKIVAEDIKAVMAEPVVEKNDGDW